MARAPKSRTSALQQSVSLGLGRITRAIFVCLAIADSAARAETLTGAQYVAPVSRYGHFALGQPHEYASLIATSSTGRELRLSLPEHEVFEDLAPRLIQAKSDGATEILAIVSRRQDGARLVMIRQRGDRLEISAESPAIGTPMRWLNPVGVADLDGDGSPEIAVVTTPHIGGTLRVYRQQGSKFVEIASLNGFSNHVIGSTELGLSMPLSIAGKMRLLVPDTPRRQLRIIGLEDGRLVEISRCALRSPLIGAIKTVSAHRISVELSTGSQIIALQNCAHAP